ncbi:MAG: ribonuclease HII [Myxococcota bacterium]
MTLRAVPLAELHRRVRSADRGGAGELVEALKRDRRLGARSLGQRLERRLDLERREAQRLAALARFESKLRRSGLARVAGVDEVGVGPLAGPVVAAAVVLPEGLRLRGLDDSKKLSRAARERLEGEIRAQALGVGVGWATPDEIDRLRIYRAGLCAMQRAVRALPDAPDALALDARRIPGLALPQYPIPGGDGKVAAIAAASIVAKVFRDAWMRDLHHRWPEYGFSRHVGYATEEHRRALAAAGPCPVHRRSFAPVREAKGAELRTEGPPFPTS